MRDYIYYDGLKTSKLDLLYIMEDFEEENGRKERLINKWSLAASDKQAEHYKKAKRIITTAKSTITRNNKKIDKIKTLLKENF